MTSRAATVGARRLGLICALVLVFGTVFASRAEAFVYWSDYDGGDGTTIGRAPLTNPNGPDKDLSFITGLGAPIGVAVNGTHIFWTTQSAPANDSVGRANLNGTGVVPTRFNTSGDPTGVALNSTHAFWATGNLIERSALGDPDGEESFVDPANVTCGVAVNATHVFWANLAQDGIGRAPLADPNGAGKDQTFIDGADDPCGVAVNGTHIYWANKGEIGVGTTIGRANLSGGDVDQSFVSGATGPCGVALNATHVFWANSSGTTIGRAPIANPSAANNSFITAANFPCGVAVDALGPPQPPPPAPEPSNEFSFGGVDRNKRKGTAELTVIVPGPGELVLAGRKVVGDTEQVGGAAALAAGAEIAVELTVKAKGKKRKRLNKKGKAKVTAEVTYTPDGGDPNIQSKKVKLKKKR